MPYKDRAMKMQNDREYHQRRREHRLQNMRTYRETHRDELLENKTRRMWIGDSYLGVAGMTRKQRQKFIEELNGTIE